MYLICNKYKECNAIKRKCGWLIPYDYKSNYILHYSEFFCNYMVDIKENYIKLIPCTPFQYQMYLSSLKDKPCI